MSEPNVRDEEVSLFALATTLLRNRWRIARWVLLGGVLAALSVISKPALYMASASFIPQGAESSRGGLASTLAGQIGVTIPSQNQSQSPDFYVRLLKSRILLTPIVRDTFVVNETGRRRLTFNELFKIGGGSQAARDEAGVSKLTGMISASVARVTGVVEVGVASEWPSVSLQIATKLINGLDDYNRRTRQAQAANERIFVESRLVIASSDLRAAEDRLESFLRTNREFSNSPELVFSRDRLQRDLTLKQDVFTSLTQAYEDVRIREVRDTPVISVLEPPSVPSAPEPRGRVKRVILGFILGGLFGMLLAFASAVFSKEKSSGAEAEEFRNVIGEMKDEMLGRFKNLKRGTAS